MLTKVDRPDAVISEGMKRVVRDLAERCVVCVVNGRDRKVVQELMGLDNLIVAGSHGFDIWSPDEGRIQHEVGSEFADELEDAKKRLREEVEPMEGSLIEEKAASVAVHFRLCSEDERLKIKGVVDALLAEHPDALKVTPGKMVYEIQPKVDWNKGKAVLYLIEALELDRENVLPLYLGDDVTDEDASGRERGPGAAGHGIGIFVGRAETRGGLGQDPADTRSPRSKSGEIWTPARWVSWEGDTGRGPYRRLAAAVVRRADASSGVGGLGRGADRPGRVLRGVHRRGSPSTARGAGPAILCGGRPGALGLRGEEAFGREETRGCR